ncbi:hypothetical protein MKW94_029446 [Papaver nudicaule]|uniref:F-box/LRR-repeat protein 15-like leucin rich repeat domain-containing protein n=1 Tax=Papaver nudicaule TaxID=74823 RepID=A0AA41SN02_PAPNU|nr:hypothetical protein [Papaver nudicaule]
MSLLCNGEYNQGSGKIYSSKSVQEGANDDGNDDDRPRKISRTDLPCDCLNLIFKCLETRDDRNSFGLTCHYWLHIQNINHESLWYRYGYGSDKFPEISREIFSVVFCKLLTRFQHLKCLSLTGHPKITDSGLSKPPFYESELQCLRLDYCSEYSNVELSLMFSWFPRLIDASLKCCSITDKGLEALAKCCSSLETVELSWCHSITDSGISSLFQKCVNLGSLRVRYCSKITGIGFLECQKSLTYVNAVGCKLQPEGIKAIVGGGGLEELILAPPYGWVNGREDSINTEAVVTIAKGCPLLKTLILPNCDELGLEGWEAIGRYCKNMKSLYVRGCRSLCDLGLQALSNGCNKLSSLVLYQENCCSSSALEVFKLEKPGVLVLRER